MNYKDLVEQREIEILQKAELCNKLYENDNQQNYINYQYQDDVELAKFIYEDYDKMDDAQRRSHVLKCLTDEDCKRILLEYELSRYHVTPSKEDLSMEEFEAEALKILSKYQSKGGGYKLEDTEWTIIRDESDEDTIIFQNTMDKWFVDDEETNSYLDRIAERLGSIAGNMTVEVSFEEDTKRKIVYVNLIVEKIENI
jgi:hypothetical protein